MQLIFGQRQLFYCSMSITSAYSRHEGTYKSAFIHSEHQVRLQGRPNFVFFLFFGTRKSTFFYFSAFYFSAEKDIRIFVFFSFFGEKMAVKNENGTVAWRPDIIHTCKRGLLAPTCVGILGNA